VITVPGSARIIGGRTAEVNVARRAARGRAVRLAAIVAIAAGCLALTPACGSREDRAERLYDKAIGQVKHHELEAAVETFRRVVAEYPDTPAAARARKEIVLYRGLTTAVRLDPSRRARETVVEAARAVERFRELRNALPTSLEDLVPAFLGEVPADPWGRPLDYERDRDGRGYRLACWGADGVPGGTGDDTDLVVRNGEFVVGTRR
jgi:hypothetical protein